MSLRTHDLQRLAGLRSVVRNRLAATVRRSAVLRGAYSRGKSADRRSGRPAGAPPGPLDRPPAELQDLLARAGTGTVPAADLDRLRRLAIDNHTQDTQGVAIAAMTLLAEQFGDRAARCWLPVMLAQAGRFEEATALQPVFAPGRPAARGYAILATALSELGRDDDAADWMRTLQDRFSGLRNEFVHIWGDDPVSAAYRQLVALSPARQGSLPVFQHLPFCAGTSMQFSLRQVVPWARTLQIGRRWGLLQIEQAERMPAAKIADYLFVHQHHPYALALSGRRLSHFTVLRDPVSQIRSGFYKRGARPKIISTRDTTSATFAEHADYTISAGLTNMLTRMIITTHPAMRRIYEKGFRSSGAFTMISNEEDMFWVRSTRKFSDDRLLTMARETLDQNFHVVGTMAHLAASHLACTATVGVPLAHTIVHRGRSGQPAAPGIGSVERRLQDANAVDQQLYEEYTARFERTYPELITAVESATATQPRS